jgi:hypothetical protein
MLPGMGRRALLFVPLFGLLVACGADGVEPELWAGSVCQAVTPWRDRIAELNGQAGLAMQAAGSARDAQRGLTDLFSGAESASESARQAVERAGVPAVEGGAEIAQRFAATLAAARDAYGHARRDVEALPTADEKAFYGQVKTISETLAQEYNAGALDVTGLASEDLRQAFEDAPQCH